MYIRLAALRTAYVLAVALAACTTVGGRPPAEPARRELPIQAPAGPGGRPVDPADRVYTADQVSNTVTVISPATNQVLGTLPLGTARMDDVLGATYYGEIDTHGLGFSPDGRTLAVVNVTTNSVTLVDTATNRVRRTVYVGRAPHEAFVAPGGRELWVAVRGLDFVSVLDLDTGRELTRIATSLGPAMVVFSPDGRFAYVNHSRSPVLVKIDVTSRQVVGRADGLASPFSPNLAVTPDGREVWLTHKDSGKVSVLDGQSLRVLAVLDTGPTTNHVNFVTTADAGYAYVTVAGTDRVLVFRRAAGAPEQVAAVPTSGPHPHGVWPSPDNRRLYVGLEGADAVDVLDTTDPARPRPLTTVRVGQQPQAVVYVAGAVPSGPGTDGLGRQGLDHRVETFRVVGPVPGTAEVTVRQLTGLDMIEVNARDLAPGVGYALWAEGPAGAHPLIRFTADAGGRGKALAFAAFFGVSERVFLRPLS